MWIMDFANDDDFSTGWSSNSTVKTPWYEVVLDKDLPFNMIVIDEYQPNIRQYKLEYEVKGVWKTIFAGENANKIKIHRFDRVVGGKVRITVERSTDPPAIMEFGVYNERR